MLTPASLPKLDPFFELILISVSMNFEIEPFLLDCHTSLMRIECETKFFDLDSTFEPKPTFEPKVDFSELVLIPELFISMKLKLNMNVNLTHNFVIQFQSLNLC